MTKGTQTGEWLPLLNYSTKHGISLSTLRRRIKSNTIQFKLENGKYFLLEEETHSRPVPRHVEEPAVVSTPKPALPHHHESGLNSSSFVEASVLTSANRLVEEIKAAYAKILQEKEEQIAQFKEEVADLRMLVRILEEGSNKKVSLTSEPAEPTYLTPLIPEEKSSGQELPEETYFGDFQTREI